MKIFLSYASERGAEAQTVYDFLKPFGFDVWYDKESLVGGQDWDHERREAQKKADLTLLVLSPETNAKVGVVQREIKEAQRQLEDHPVGSIYLVTLRTDAITVPTELARWQYIDLFKSDWRVRLSRALELKCRQLAQSIPVSLAEFLFHSSAAQQQIKTIQEDHSYGELDASFFTYNLGGDFWQWVNAEIIAEVYRSYYQHKADFVANPPEPHAQKGVWSYRVEEFFRDGELLSLRFFWYGYTGGAHGSHAIWTKNLSSLLGPFSLNDLFVGGEKALNFLRRYCDIDLKRQFLDENGESSVDLSPYFTDCTPHDPWLLFNQFNIDKSGMLINFSPYDILPYAFGSQEVRISWNDIRPYLEGAFVNGPIGKQLGLS